MRIRATTRLRNDHMIAARKRLGWSQADLAGNAIVSITWVQQFEALQYHRDAVRRNEAALAIADVLGIPVEQVAPEALAGKILPSTLTVVRNVDSEALLAAVGARETRLALPAPGARLEWQEAAEAIKAAMKTLSFREREVLNLRFGLNDGECYNLNEVGRIFKVTPQRVRQVEAKAIRKLQNPVRSNRLREFAIQEA